MKSESWLSALMRKEIALTLFALLLVVLWSVLSCAEAYKPDAVANLAWLHSILFDHDLHFGNEYKILKQSMFQAYASETAYRVNPLGVGAAILLLPFYLLGFVGTFIHNYNSVNPLAYDGLNIMFRQAAGLGGAFYGAATLFLSARIAACFGSRRTALWAAMLTVAGTPLLYYSSIGSLYPHTATAFLVALFIDRLLVEHKNLWNIVFMGLVGGMMLCASLQCIFILLLLPLAWWLNRKWSINVWIIFTASLLVGFMPQLFVWQRIYGAPLPIRDLLIWQGQAGFSPLQMLFSSHHGLFIWSPLLIFSFIGFGLFYQRQRLYSLLLTAVCLFFILINSIFRLYDDFAFGARQMTACLPLFTIGLTLFLRRMETLEQPIIRGLLALILFICTAWSLLLLGVFAAHMPDNEYISFADLSERLVLYIDGNAGGLDLLTDNSMPASNGGRIMLLFFTLAALAFAYLPSVVQRIIPVLLISISAASFCTVAVLPQNIEDKLNVAQRIEWRKWIKLRDKPAAGAADLKERSICANKLLMIDVAEDLRCRVAESTRDPQDALDCAILHLMMQQPDKAEETILQYGLEKRQDEYVYYHLGVIERMRFNPAKAVTWFKTSNDIKPNVAALMMLANSYYELNEYELAAGIYRGILEDNPENQGAQSGLKRVTFK